MLEYKKYVKKPVYSQKKRFYIEPEKVLYRTLKGSKALRIWNP